MKLYYAAGTCSLAPHIALREAGLSFELVRYDIRAGTLEGGGQITDVNDKGYVPVLELDNGERLTEAAVVLGYIADQVPGAGLAPLRGTFARYRLDEWLNFLATEVHKVYWPLLHDGCEAERPAAAARIAKRFGWIQEKLGDRPFLFGEGFSVADAYLVTLLNWAKPAGIDLASWPALKAYRSRLLERPSVQAALTAEGFKRRAA